MQQYAVCRSEIPLRSSFFRPERVQDVSIRGEWFLPARRDQIFHRTEPSRMVDYIVLIRRKPSPEAAVSLMSDLREARRADRCARAFFHGDGVDATLDAAPDWARADPDVAWCICQTSLERRMPSGGVPSGFTTATLVAFFQAVSSACRVDSIGLGGSLCYRTEPDVVPGEAENLLLMEVGFAPADPRQRRETLEMALGAAALELEASVLFHGAGLAHLTGDAARGWAQVTDFGLLDMYAESAGDLCGTAIEVQTMNAVEAAALRARAATILIL